MTVRWSKTDEDQIGAYDELEWAMQQPLKVILLNPSQEEKEAYVYTVGYNSRNQHKMPPIPVWNFLKS
jgi:NAD+ synthase